MSDTTARFSQGGYIPGPGRTMRCVAEPSPDGLGSMDVIYADECVINQDRVCVRKDQLHAAVPGAVRSRQARWYTCPMHDYPKKWKP